MAVQRPPAERSQTGPCTSGRPQRPQRPAGTPGGELGARLARAVSAAEEHGGSQAGRPLQRARDRRHLRRQLPAPPAASALSVLA